MPTPASMTTQEAINHKNGKLIIVTAPSGAGKTTIVRHLLSVFDELDFSTSATTRDMRPGEVDGEDYYFLSQDAFKLKIENQEFVEWEEVYENQFYGTLKSEIDRIWKTGKHVIFDIDVNGARNLQNLYPADALSIFIQPPSESALLARLEGRQSEDEASLKKRMARSAKELTYANYFDLVLVNDILDDALKNSERIISRYLNLDYE